MPRGAFGLAALLFIAWALSEDRWHVPLRVVAAGVLLQFGLALLFLKVPFAGRAFLVLNDGVEALQKATDAGTGFVFGYLGGGTPPFAETQPGAAFIFAFRRNPAGPGLHLRLSRPAAGAGDQCAGDAAVLLGRAATHRARLRLGAAAHGGDRRAARPGRGGAQAAAALPAHGALAFGVNFPARCAGYATGA